jgi:AP-4 complex subunit mu-1
MYISQVFVLSPRGDKIIFKDYRHDVARNSDEIFFRKYKFWEGDEGRDAAHQQHHVVSGDCPPFFVEKNVFFSFVRRQGLLIVATTPIFDASPSFFAEVLSRFCKVLKDFLGVLSEDAIRKNFAIVYELLDEMIDTGVVQDMNTESLRPYVFNDVVASEPVVAAPKQEGMIARLRKGDFGLGDKTRRSTATNVSVAGGGSANKKNEIFIDVIERLNVVFNSQGNVLTSEVDGSIQMKSFLTGSPDLYLGLNDDLVVGRDDSRGKYATVCLDSVNFHESADSTRFEAERVVMMRPPSGEFVVMNYRMTGDFTQPFRIIPSIEVVSTYKAELTLRVRADIPTATQGINVFVRCPMPKAATSVSVELGVGAQAQKYEYRQAEKMVVWSIPKFKGGTEHVCKIGVAMGAPFVAASRKEMGPISMVFEVPNHNVSGIAIKFLRLEERSESYNPQRWVRNITQANSYVTRMQ